MIYVKLEGHDFFYGIEHILKVFFPDKSVIYAENQFPEGFQGIFVCSTLALKDGKISLYTELINSNENVYKNTVWLDGNIDKADYKRIIGKEATREVYFALVKLTQKSQPWGMLIGIRPAKLVQDMLAEGKTRDEIFKRLMEYQMVSREKVELLYDVAVLEKEILDKTKPNMIGLYIGIPFCTSRCLYCSFTSDTIYKSKNIISEYIAALKKEIINTGKIINEKGYKIQSIYIGGGTPTAIEPKLLEILLSSIDESFDISNLLEYTLEAGRADSIDKEKLEIIKSSKVDRISINPQSMNDKTLRLIGRNHTAKDVVDSFNLARELGFDNINMDVIIGLPGENIDMFENTLRGIGELLPESLTVHTMAVKRSSRLRDEKGNYEFIKYDQAARMIDLSSAFARSMDMKPYYMYRQKNMIGNLENVGYSKPGYESVYNVQIMEERQTILALGAGGITKVVYPQENRIERAFNVKNADEYIKRVDEMVERKRKLIFEG